ncbi:MAG: TetR/AcrR family transcriptional regulator [Dehalococcoidia bacterium]|nr:TetR/AcrR family transcriptional regulator [Dehalococcoidia bacterium]
MPSPVSPARTRKERDDGRETRRRILTTAAQLATTEGLEGLSIGRLAQATGLSKSGVYAHFRSKEDLQLATVETANAIYADEVISAAAGTRPAIDRLYALCEAQLSYTERRVFAGGCFFVSSLPEFRSRNGPVRDRLSAILAEWLDFLVGLVEEAVAEGALAAATDTRQLAFELTAVLEYADLLYVLEDDRAALDRARASIARLLPR